MIPGIRNSNSIIWKRMLFHESFSENESYSVLISNDRFQGMAKKDELSTWLQYPSLYTSHSMILVV